MCAPRHTALGFNKLQYSDFIFLALLPSWVVKVFSEGRFRTLSRNGIYRLLIVLLTAVWCSISNSVNFFASIVDWLGLAYLVLLFIVTTDLINSCGRLKRLMFVYSVSAVIVALAGLAAFLKSGGSMSASGSSHLLYHHPAESSVLFFSRIQSFFYTPNMFAIYEHTALAVIMALFFWLKSQGSPLLPRILLLIGAGIIFISVFFAGSQTFAGILLSLFIMSWLFRGKLAAFMRYAVFLIVMAAACLAICATLWMIYPLKVTHDPKEELLNVNINVAYSHHVIPSFYALSMFREHPFLGVGAGTFTGQYPKYVDFKIEKNSCLRMKEPIGYVLDPHNTYTGLLAEWGIIGLSALIGVFIALIRMLILSYKRNESLLSDGARFSLLAGFIGFLFNALFIDVVMMRHLWLMMAIIFIVCRDKVRVCAG